MMLTRCPACQTTFRLGPEQLRAHQGEVRCGHCFHPFNALEHEIVPPTSAPQGAYRASPQAEPREAGLAPISQGPVATQEAAPQDAPPPEPGFIVLEEKSAAPSPAADDQGFALPGELPPPSPRPTPPGSGTLDPAATAREENKPPVLPEVLRSSRRTAAGTDTAPDAPAGRAQPGHESSIAGPHGPDDGAGLEDAGPAADPTTDGDASATGTEQADTALLRPAPHSPPKEPPRAAHVDIEQLDAKYGRPKAPASPRQRALASLAVGLLGGLLAAQCVYLYRMEIARDLPGLRPLLETACATFGCTVPFPRDIQQISVDLSDLQSEPGKPGQYILYATISNRAGHVQAWPHLELTLTDARDTPVARRVLAPHEWIPPAQHGDTFASRSAVNVRLAFAAPDLAPTGYRIDKFYP
ncbi:DUF3426 domain-containing protein [Thauera sp.]|uniref:DUF3426 domain-containing protein n=1 Tax=Thauera sp. TaxID=1905334 RepID=UPI0039E6AF20